MNKTQLCQAFDVSTGTISKLRKNEQIFMDAMQKICKVFRLWHRRHCRSGRCWQCGF